MNPRYPLAPIEAISGMPPSPQRRLAASRNKRRVYAIDICIALDLEDLRWPDAIPGHHCQAKMEGSLGLYPRDRQ